MPGSPAAAYSRLLSTSVSPLELFGASAAASLHWTRPHEFCTTHQGKGSASAGHTRALWSLPAWGRATKGFGVTTGAQLRLPLRPRRRGSICICEVAQVSACASRGHVPGAPPGLKWALSRGSFWFIEHTFGCGSRTHMFVHAALSSKRHCNLDFRS